MPTMDEEGFGEKYGVLAVVAFLCCFFEAGLPPTAAAAADPPGRSLFLPFSIMIVMFVLWHDLLLYHNTDCSSYSSRG